MGSRNHGSWNLWQEQSAVEVEFCESLRTFVGINPIIERRFGAPHQLGNTPFAQALDHLPADLVRMRIQLQPRTRGPSRSPQRLAFGPTFRQRFPSPGRDEFTLDLCR